MPDPSLQVLENKLDQLLQLCDRLYSDNQSLLQREQQWQQERTRLIEKNELACSRVETMINKLKNIESEI